jgi:hypothetical protein
MSQTRAAILLLLVLSIGLLGGCAPTDPMQRALEDRARWQVTLLSWTQLETGEIDASLRISGPRTTSLPTLTVKLLLMDAGEAPVGHEWHSFELSEIEGGGPEDVFVRLPAREFEVHGLGVDLLNYPDDAERAHIPELPN